MVGGERKTGSAFSWADEVEREEEEARVGNCEGKRSNPFGSARPREVVLQEKGIDWRKLDQDLHQSSNIRYEAPVEKPLKENNPAFSARGGNKNQRSKPETKDLVFGSRGVSGGFMIPQKPMGAVFVAPPARYQTRNVLACLPEESYSYHNSQISDSEDDMFQHRNRIDFLYGNGNEAARERMFHEPQRRQFYNSGGLGLGIEGRIHHYDDRFVGREGEYPELHLNGRRYSEVGLRRPWIMMEPPHCLRNFEESVACEERRAYTDYNRSPLLKRPPYIVDHHHARNGGIGRKLTNQPYNGTAQHGQRPRQPLHNNSGCRMMKSARRETCLEKEKAQLADGSMEEAVADGRRAEVQCSVKKGANSVRNGRKRSMKSTPESNHLHGKRR